MKMDDKPVSTEALLLAMLSELKQEQKDLHLYIRTHMEQEEVNLKEIRENIAQLTTNLAVVSEQVKTNKAKWGFVSTVVVACIVSFLTTLIGLI